MASRRWRKKLQRSNSSMCFEGWRVMLMGETSKIEGFSRVLGVGGASVTCIRGDEDIVELSDVMVSSEGRPV